jgi:T5SS/PEP-CTERM-associated repeat protein
MHHRSLAGSNGASRVTRWFSRRLLSSSSALAAVLLPVAAHAADEIIDSGPPPTTVSSATTFGNITVGNVNGSQSLFIQSATVSYTGFTVIGFGTSSVFSNANTLTVTGPGAVMQTSAPSTITGPALIVGEFGTSNQLVVSAGGQVAITHVSTGGPDDVVVGYKTSAGANRITVTGAGSRFSSSQSGLYIGLNSNGNELDALNGGAVSTNLMRVGGGTGSTTPGNGNIVKIDGAGSTLTVNQTLRVGSGGSGNQLIVSNGGHVVVTGNLFDGFDVNSGNNQIAVSGTNSQLTAGALLVGNGGGANNSLLVSNGGAISAGSMSFSSSSFYLMDINAAKPSLLTVSGAAALGGTVQPLFSPGTSLASQTAILHTAIRTGTFATLDASNVPAGFTASLAYTPTDVFLDLTTTFGQQAGLNVNQRNVAAALNGYFSGGGTLPPAVVGVFGLTGVNLANALIQLSGEVGTGPQQATFNAMNQFMGVLDDPFIDGRGGGAATTGASPFAEADGASAYASSGRSRDAHAMFAKATTLADPARRWSVWAAGYGGSQTSDGNAVLGSNSTTSRIYGVAVGADYRLSPATLAGFALAGGGTSFSVADALGSGRSDLFQAGAFIRHQVGAAYLSGALAYGWQDITTNRTVTVAGLDQLRAQFNANAWSGRVEGGYRLVAPGLAIGITPYAAGQFTTFDLPAHPEQAVAGANTFVLAYGASRATASRSEIGLRTDKSVAMADGILTLRGRAAWAHDDNTDRAIGATFQALPGASFVVNGATPAHDAALVTASAEFKWMNGWSTAATFEGEFSNVTRSYAGKTVVRYQW